MWDSNAPLQLLQTMPKKLSKENLEKIQMVIDADKYKNSIISGFDLCGMYAPFCRGCKKTSIYPCALAYISMMKAEGMDVEIDARPMFAPAPQPVKVKTEEPVKEEVAEEKVAKKVEAQPPVEEPAEEKVAKTEKVEAQPPVEEPVEEKISKTEEVSPVGEPAQRTEKRKIRIAVARKKLY